MIGYGKLLLSLTKEHGLIVGVLWVLLDSWDITHFCTIINSEDA